MKSLIGIVGLIASSALIGGGVYAFSRSGNDNSDSTGDSASKGFVAPTSNDPLHFLVTVDTSEKTKPTEVESNTQNDESTKQDFYCELKITEGSQTPPEQEQTHKIEDCVLKKINFSDKSKAIFWDEIEKTKDTTPTLKYSDFFSVDRAGYNKADAWYILAISKDQASNYISNTPKRMGHKIKKNKLDESKDENNYVSLQIHHKFSYSTGIDNKSNPYMIAQLKNLDDTNSEEKAQHPCYFAEEDISKNKKTCQIFETNTKDDIKNIKFESIQFPNHSNGIKTLSSLTKENFYLIDIDSIESWNPDTTKNFHIVMNQDANSQEKKLATFKFISWFTGTFSNAQNMEEVMVFNKSTL